MASVRSFCMTSEPWRVGVLFSKTGLMAVVKERPLRSTPFAIDEIHAVHEVNGHEIVPASYNPAFEGSAFGQSMRCPIVPARMPWMPSGWRLEWP